MTTPRCIVCTCEDVTETELHEAVEEGYDDLETLKRYTGFATGPCQGKACVVVARRLLARWKGAPEGDLGAITYRPPLVPVPLGALAGDEVEEEPPREEPK